MYAKFGCFKMLTKFSYSMESFGDGCRELNRELYKL